MRRLSCCRSCKRRVGTAPARGLWLAGIVAAAPLQPAARRARAARRGRHRRPPRRSSLPPARSSPETPDAISPWIPTSSRIDRFLNRPDLKLRCSCAAMAGHPTQRLRQRDYLPVRLRRTRVRLSLAGKPPHDSAQGHTPQGPPRRRRLLLHQPRPQEFFSPSERAVPKRSIFRAIVICKCKRFSSKIFSFHSTCYSHHIELLYIFSYS